MGLANELVGKIKRRMKDRNLTYKELATKLGLSEATLKRSFSKNLFTIERIEEICEALSLTLEEIAKPDGDQFKIEYLSQEQELFLEADEEALVVFYLVISGVPLPTVRKHFIFEEKRLQRILLQLDKLNLIKLYPGDRVISNIKQRVWWTIGGPLREKYDIQMRQDFVNSTFTQKNERAWITAGSLSPSSLATIEKKQDKVVSEFNDLVELDGHLPLQEKVNVTFVSGVRPWTMPAVQKYRRRKIRLNRDSKIDPNF